MIGMARPLSTDATAQARASLGMDDLLDSLLTIPTAALGASAPPPALSIPPRISSRAMPAMRAPPGASQYPRVDPRVDPRAEPVSAPPPPRAPAPAIDKRAVPKIIAPDLARVGLDHRGAFLLGFIDGGTTVEGIVDASGIGEEEALAILADLTKRGAISLR